MTKYRSKYYPKEESWIGEDAWAIEIPKLKIDDPDTQHIDLKLQEDPGSERYYHLKVPTSFFKLHWDSFYFRADRNNISLFLSAVPVTIFTDKRGSGKINFKEFLQ